MKYIFEKDDCEKIRKLHGGHPPMSVFLLFQKCHIGKVKISESRYGFERYFCKISIEDIETQKCFERTVLFRSFCWYQREKRLSRIEEAKLERRLKNFPYRVEIPRLGMNHRYKFANFYKWCEENFGKESILRSWVIHNGWAYFKKEDHAFVFGIRMPAC